MTIAVEATKPRGMIVSDLDSIAALHKSCFPDSLSIFSALSNGIVRSFYAQVLQEPENYVAVLEDAATGRLVGMAFGTLKLGVQNRFVQQHMIWFAASLITRGFVSIAIWKYVWKRLFRKTGLGLRTYDYALEQAGIPPPKGSEAFFVLLGMHPEWRGGGNAERMVKYFTNQMFRTGAVRIRGAIRSDNIPSLILHKRLGWNSRKVAPSEICVWIDRPNFVLNIPPILGKFCKWSVMNAQSPAAELVVVAVSPDAKGKGVAQSLIARMESFMQSNGLSGPYTILTEASNARANGFYRKIGAAHIRTGFNRGREINEWHKFPGMKSDARDQA